MNMSTEDKKPTEPHMQVTAANKQVSGPRRLSVAELLAGDREVILEHSGQDYRLRITANGKLILTK
jgi:hemin uptake protein HemP